MSFTYDDGPSMQEVLDDYRERLSGDVLRRLAIECESFSAECAGDPSVGIWPDDEGGFGWSIAADLLRTEADRRDAAAAAAKADLDARRIAGEDPWDPYPVVDYRPCQDAGTHVATQRHTKAECPAENAPF